MMIGKPGRAMSVAERTRLHRERARTRDILAAVAVARMVVGKDPGDARLSLARWLERMAGLQEVPEEYVDEMIEAAGRISRRR